MKFYNILLILNLFIFQNVFSQSKIEIEKLPAPVNSNLDEVSCVISSDGKTLFFTRSMHPQNSQSGKSADFMMAYPEKIRDSIAWSNYGMSLEDLNFSREASIKFGQKIYCSADVNQDIWIANIDSSRKYTVWHPEQTINTANNNSVCCAMPGNRLLLFGEYEDGVSRTIGYSTCSYNEKFYFTQPKDVNIKNYYKNQFNSLVRGMGTKKNAYITGPVLLFSEKMDITFGREDIFVSFFKSKENQWSEPINLGNVINTPFTENRPFLTKDTRTLFYASDAAGSLDIYFSQRLDESWTNWSKPQALPYPVNTPTSDDGYFYKDYESPTTYFCSNRAGSYDIYTFELSDIYLFSQDFEVSVFDKQTKMPVKANITIISGRDTSSFENVEILKEKTNSEKDLQINVSAPAYMSVDTIVKPALNNKYKILISLEKMKIEENIVLKNIIFLAGSDKIDSYDKEEIAKIFRMLKNKPSMTIRIEGHTNNIGNIDKLRELSLNRAEAVKQILVTAGIAPERLETIGFGPDKPIFDNNDQEKRKFNQRVEISILTE